MKLLLLILIYCGLAFELHAQNARFEQELNGLACYANLESIKGSYIKTSNKKKTYQCKRTLFGFETTMNDMNGLLSFLAEARTPNEVTAKDLEECIKKGIAGFVRINDDIIKESAPADASSMVGFITSDKRRVVTISTSTDGTLRVIIIDDPNVIWPELIYLKDKKTKKIGYQEITGGSNWRILPKYDEAHSFSEGLASVSIDGKWGFIDVNGKEVTGIQYQDAGQFKEGLAAVNSGGKYGYINRSGTLVIPLEFNYAMVFENGAANVILNGERFQIDWYGKKIVK